MLGVAGYAFYLNLKLDTAEAEAGRLKGQYAQVLSTNQLQANTIKRMADQRRIDDELLVTLQSNANEARRLSTRLTKGLDGLGENYDTIKNYFDTRVPIDVTRMLIDRTTPGPSGNNKADATGNGAD
jgi:type II secretory pathway pseudopilin PulG